MILKNVFFCDIIYDMSRLTKELSLNIRKGILSGKQYIDIQKELQISAGTWDYWYWDNFESKEMNQGFRDFVKSCKYERMMRAVEDNIDDLLYMDDIGKDGRRDPALTKIKQDTTKFVAENLGRIDFHKHSTTDVTTKGKELPTPLLNTLHVLYNNSDSQDSEIKEQD